MIKSYEEIYGWFDFEDIYDAAVDNNLSGSVFVEVGAWAGKSTAYMAQKIKNSGKEIKFYVVDTFQGQPSYKEHVDFVSANGGSIFGLFKQNMEDLGLLEFLNPVISLSESAPQLIPHFEYDFVFIDANHDYEFVIKDIQTYWPLVKKGGVLAGHDAAWPGVSRSLKEFFTNTGINVAISKNSWIVQK